MNVFTGEGKFGSKNKVLHYFKKHFVSFTVNGQHHFKADGKSVG